MTIEIGSENIRVEGTTRRRRTLELAATRRAELEHFRDLLRPYQRERAAALLKSADGSAPHWVARSGLRTRRDPDTVSSSCKSC